MIFMNYHSMIYKCFKLYYGNIIYNNYLNKNKDETCEIKFECFKKNEFI